MTVRAQVLVSLLVTVTAIVFEARTARPEPLHVTAASRAMLLSEHVSDRDRTWKISAANLSVRAGKHDRSPIASVMRQLDLSKLTLADFGDTE